MLLNGVAGVLAASGVAADLGINPQPGGDEQVDRAEQSAENVEAGGGFGSTLFALYTTVTGTFETVYKLVFYGPTMLENLGVPGWMTGLFNSVITLVVATDIAYILTGRDA